MCAGADLAASLLPKSLLGACTEVFSKFRPQDEGQENQEALKSGQDHIFTFYGELSEEDKAQLDADFDAFRVEEFEEAWVRQSNNDFTAQGISIEPPRVLNWELKRPPTPGTGANLSKTSDVSERKQSMWRNVGLELYFKNRVAIVIMSGGKDSRMGDGVPKGVLDIGLLSGKSIFQLYFERVLRLQHLVKRKHKHMVCIPIYVMCNSENRGIIEEFLHENNFFGIREQDLLFFTQGNFPVCDAKGKILLREKHRIAQEPNGNGGLFRALLEEGMISDMKSRGVTSIYVGAIDNVLAMVGDPCFVGYCEVCKVEAGLKCVEKVSPEEHFGVFANKTLASKFEDLDGDGKVEEVSKTKATVVEFFELPDDLKKRRLRLSTGASPLTLCCGNISQYYFKVDFIKRIQGQMVKRWHAIPKLVSYVNPKTGNRVVAPDGSEKNGRRLEMFVFDAFEFTKSVAALEVDRGEFANVKRISGPNSPQTAMVAMGRLHQRWILAAGGRFNNQRIATEREDTQCEISPLVSYAGEDLGGQFPAPINLPFYLPSRQELLQFSAASSAQTRRASVHYLDWYSELAQRELEIELNQHLGGVMDMIEDPTTMDYMGERALDEELLPPTPRHALSNDETLRSPTGSRRHSSISSAAGAVASPQAPSSVQGEAVPEGRQAGEGPGDQKEEQQQQQRSGESPRGKKSSPRKTAANSPRGKPPGKPGVKARQNYWGQEAAEEALKSKGGSADAA